MLRETSKILAEAVENGSICFSDGVYSLPGMEIRPEEVLANAQTQGMIDKDSKTTTCGRFSGVFVKRYNKTGVWRTLKRFFGYPRAYRCLAASLLLEKLPLLTPRVFYASRYYLATESLPDEETLFLSWRPERIQGFLPLLARFHEAGLAHGDLNLRNVYFDRKNEKYGVIDLDGVTISPDPISRPMRSWELARALSSFWKQHGVFGLEKITLDEALEKYLSIYEEASNMKFSRKSIRKRVDAFLKK